MSGNQECDYLVPNVQLVDPVRIILFRGTQHQFQKIFVCTAGVLAPSADHLVDNVGHVCLANVVACVRASCEKTSDCGRLDERGPLRMGQSADHGFDKRMLFFAFERVEGVAEPRSADCLEVNLVMSAETSMGEPVP